MIVLTWISHSSQYSNHLNTGLIWYLNGRFVLKCVLFGCIQMVVWKPDWKKTVYGPKCPVSKWSTKSHDLTLWMPDSHTVRYSDGYYNCQSMSPKYPISLLQWGLKIRTWNTECHPNTEHFKVRISNGPFKNQTFQNGRFSLGRFISKHYLSLCIKQPRLKWPFYFFLCI